jgi:hypothetical protein
VCVEGGSGRRSYLARDTIKRSDKIFICRALWSLSRKGYETHRGTFWTHKISLLPEVDRVLREGAEIDSTDACGDTALHGASAKGHKDIVAALLQWGASCCIRNNNGATPNVKGMKALHAVSAKGTPDCVQAICRTATSSPC